MFQRRHYFVHSVQKRKQLYISVLAFLTGLVQAEQCIFKLKLLFVNEGHVLIDIDEVNNIRVLFSLAGQALHSVQQLQAILEYFERIIKLELLGVRNCQVVDWEKANQVHAVNVIEVILIGASGCDSGYAQLFLVNLLYW